jgi:hypothetical protein
MKFKYINFLLIILLLLVPLQVFAQSTCTDSDGGKNIYQKGTATDADETQTDSCSTYTANRILERWCRDGISVEGYYQDCPSGYTCSDGACITDQTEICTDSDGGKDYYVQGTASGIYGSGTDFCYGEKYPSSNQKNYVQEYFCDPNNPWSASTGYNCPNGCSNGACIKDSPKVDPIHEACQKLLHKTNSSFGSQCVDFRYDYTADVNNDKIVNIHDMTLIGQNSNNANWCTTNYQNPKNPCGDINICTDTDGGKNYLIKGTTKGWASDAVMTTRVDSCRAPNYYGDGYDYLIEWHCWTNPDDRKEYAINTNEKCLNGCSNGACIKDSPKVDPIHEACQKLLYKTNSSFGSQCGEFRYDYTADVNNDKIVNIHDMTLIGQNSNNANWCTKNYLDSQDSCRFTDGSTIRDTLDKEETRTYTANGILYELHIAYLDSKSAKIWVRLPGAFNTETTSLLRVGESYVFGELTKIKLNDILYQDFAGGVKMIGFTLVAPEKEVCIDTDNGKDYFVKGSAKVVIHKDDGIYKSTIIDYCSKDYDQSKSENMLFEAYCREDKSSGHERYVCPNGCSNGACIKDSPKVDPIHEACQKLLDLTRVSFGSKCGHSIYNPGADINKDKAVNVHDQIIIGQNSNNANWCTTNYQNPKNPCGDINICTDTDGGKDYFRKGRVKYNLQHDEEYQYEIIDSCSGSTVNEYYCDVNGNAQTEYFKCETGCKNGACIEEDEERADLSNYPEPFVKDGKLNAVLVVGSKASSVDVISVTDILTSLGRYSNIVGGAKLDSEINDPLSQNVITVGTPCDNKVTAKWLSTRRDINIKESGKHCQFGGLGPGISMIELLEHKGSTGVVVSGTNPEDTRKAAHVLGNFKQWQNKEKLRGTRVLVEGKSINDLEVYSIDVDEILPEPSLPPRLPYENVEDITLFNGWNLVSLSGELDQFLGHTCNKLVAFVYLKEQDRYVTIEEARRILDDELGKYMGNNAFWIYSFDQCSLEVATKDVKQNIKLVEGWNLAPVTKDHIGKTFNQISFTCDIESAYNWNAKDQEWENINVNVEYRFHPEQQKTGIVVRSRNSCELK